MGHTHTHTHTPAPTHTHMVASVRHAGGDSSGGFFE